MRKDRDRRKRLAEKISKRVEGIDKKIHIAVMGCVVNGIGESSHCDIGVAGGKYKSALFKDGKILETVSNENLLDRLMELIDKI